jgi:hypothetical protein
MQTPDPTSFTSIMDYVSSGGAAVGIIATVLVFLKFLRNLVSDFRQTLADQRRDFSQSLERLVASNERTSAQIIARLDANTTLLTRLDQRHQDAKP